MSNISLFEGMPDSYRALLATLQPETTIAGGYGGGSRLSIRGGVFRKIVAGEEVGTIDSRTLQTVIVKAAPISRTYYAGAYVEGTNQGPACWSEDGKVPHADVADGDRQSTDCNSCPMNIKGSGTGDSRACRFQQRVAVLLPDGENHFVSAEAHLLSLPATSLFGDAADKMQMQAYVRKLHAHKTPLAAVVTEMRFDTDSSTPKLSFKPIRALTETELGMVARLQKDPEVEELIRMDYKPTEQQQATPEALFAPEPAPVKAKAEKKPAPVVVEEDSDEDEEPVVKPKAKAPPAPPAAPLNLADMVGNWDD
jgi:hypothetical protein